MASPFPAPLTSGAPVPVRRARRAWVGALALAAPLPLVLAPPSSAAQKSETIAFDVPAQPLADALTQAARQAGVQILFPHAAIRGRNSRALRGRMTPRAAIERLIAGSGLRIVSARPRVVTLGLAPPRTRAAPAAAPARKPAWRSPPPTGPGEADHPVEIVVTGRPMSSPLTAAETSYSVTVIDDARLAANITRPTAELLKLVPGFWIESSGGEAANNVRARGIPTDGFSSVAIEENGLPVQYDGALGFFNTDQSFRVDDTIARVEAVRGGPSSLFSSNAPAGVVNFISRNGLDHRGGALALTVGPEAYARVDGHAAWQLSANIGATVGGFFRISDGRRNTGFRADEGGQARASLIWRDGGHELMLDVKHIADRVAFYLPVPLGFADDGSVVPIPGFDPLADTLAGPDTNGVAMRSARGTVDFNLDRGTTTRLTSMTAAARIPLGSGWSITSRSRFRRSETQRNALFPTGSPVPAETFLAGLTATARSAFPNTTALALRYAGSGAAFDMAGSGLTLGGNLMTIDLPMREVVTDQRLSGTLRWGGTHQIAAGLTVADYSYGFHRYTSTALLAVEGQARRLDVVALDQAGAVIGRVTDNGFQRYGSLYDDADMRSSALAFYAADEWQVAPEVRIDLGLRWERVRVRGRVAGTIAVDLGDPTTLADDAVTAPSGTVTQVRHHYADAGWSIGASVGLSPRSSLFARYTDSFRLPSSSEFIGNPMRSDQASVPIRMAEAGVKHAGKHLTLSATLFYTRFDRLPFVDRRFDTVTNTYVERTAIAGTGALGAEIEAVFRPVEPFDFTLLATLQDSRYRDFQFTELVGGVPIKRDYRGNHLVRVPPLNLRAMPALTLAGGRLRVEASLALFGRRYADIANTRELPPYTLLDLAATAQLKSGWSVALRVDNVTNSLGLTEGNPRTGAFEAGDPTSRYFLARPEFGRTLRLTARHRF